MKCIWLWASLLSITLSVKDTNGLRIPLTYVYSNDFSLTMPISLSFDTQDTFTPNGDTLLRLPGLNLTVKAKIGATNTVLIGLAYPSQFIGAVAAVYGVPYSQIQMGKDDYLELRLGDINYVESTDQFIQGADYDVKVVFNYGSETTLFNRRVELVDSNTIYFDQILLRSILNQMSGENHIKYQFDVRTQRVTFSGELGNFPQITLKRGSTQFHLNIDPLQVRFIQSNETHGSTKVGYRLLSDFSKFKFSDSGGFLFKRTSLLFMLYLFLGCFVTGSLLLLYVTRKDLFATSVFVQNIFKWILFQNNDARLAVLATQIE